MEPSFSEEHFSRHSLLEPFFFFPFSLMDFLSGSQNRQRTAQREENNWQERPRQDNHAISCKACKEIDVQERGPGIFFCNLLVLLALLTFCLSITRLKRYFQVQTAKEQLFQPSLSTTTTTMKLLVLIPWLINLLSLSHFNFLAYIWYWKPTYLASTMSANLSQ